jgi:glycosyltransferase involved in cell wall biosynthesis
MSKKTSILLTVHDKEFLIERVCQGIINNVSESVDQIILVFDGCKDRSEELAKPIINKFNKKVNYLYADDVFETKANNVGLKEVTSDYVIIIQDDMVVREKDFDKRMMEPFKTFSDVFAVTSFRAHNDRVFNGDMINHTDVIDGKWGYPRDKFGVREIANRGPLMYDFNDVVKLNYLDEVFSPQTYDDHDISFRAWSELGKVSGLYWIDWFSDLNWGTTRIKSQPIIQEANRKNEIIISQRWGHILDGRILNEDRKI